ncbi:MAG: hypothetical protein Q7K41_06845, partial [Dehalococcoidales bacterium]|nr:hypothetical protein [Dehalococcoidales bacterium]
MKTSSARHISELMQQAETCYQASCSSNEAEEEPPSRRVISGELEEEPPHQAVTNRSRFFGHIPDNLWNDWKWHFRNRITSVEQLAQFIPLSREAQARLKLVTRRYPLAITPYYLSLINPEDLDDPIRKQAVPSILEISMGAMGMEDPLEEKKGSMVPGLVHRYPDRVLMTF